MNVLFRVLLPEMRVTVILFVSIFKKELNDNQSYIKRLCLSKSYVHVIRV